MTHSSQACSFKVGERYKDFKVTKSLPIKELSSTLIELEHIPSGAMVMHIANDDPENLFCLSFKTLPSCSDGAAHILEHTVLCGSKKFPVKDPFFAMTRRSLNTFMNAMTGSDFTCYPAASLVEKDFYNLLDVYIDAVFYPKLQELSFLQEGHRLSFQKETDPKSPLVVKGIVFNEMKGSMSSPENRMWHELLEHLTPDLPYAHNSGGDPKVIPSLSYHGLIEFYEKFYHPSRCLFFFYGNLPLQKHLDFIEEKALKSVAKEPSLPPIPKQPRFKEPKTFYSFYPATESDGEDDKDIIAFGYLTSKVEDQEEILALSVLDSILMDTDASLLKRPLLESGLCIQADAYMDTEMTEVPYAIVFRGCKKENLEAIEKLLKDSLKKIAASPIEERLVDAAMHQLELSRTEINSDGGPFGLTLFMRAALAKQHGCAPEYSLMVHSLFENLLKKVKDKDFFGNLIRKHFLDNTHLVKLIMSPKKELAKEEEALERAQLDALQQKLSQQDIENIINTSKELKKYQEIVEHQDIECLPKVTLDDVPKEARDFPLNSFEISGISAHHYESFTNHIFYTDLVFKLPKLSEEELQYCALLATLVPELGSANRSYTENLEEHHAHTGGITATCSFLSHISSPTTIRPVIIFKGKALERKGSKFFPLFLDTINACRFDEKTRIKELILQIHTSLHSKINRNAMRYASQLALSSLSPAGHLNNLWYGVPYFQFINSLKKKLDSEIDDIILKLSNLYHKLFSKQNAELIIACDKDYIEYLKKEKFFGIDALKTTAVDTPNESLSPKEIESQARIIAAHVAFNVEAFKCASYTHPLSPAIFVASQIFDNKILHTKIREQGGAYGSGAHYNAMNGTFYFSSYRDPHIASTFDVFEEALEFIANGNFTDKDLEEAKLGMIQSFDTPLSPMARALTAFNWQQEGKTKAIRQEYRNKLLQLTKEDVQKAIKEELINKKAKTIKISFAGESLIEKENKILETNGKNLAVYPL